MVLKSQLVHKNLYIYSIYIYFKHCSVFILVMSHYSLLFSPSTEVAVGVMILAVKEEESSSIRRVLSSFICPPCLFLQENNFFLTSPANTTNKRPLAKP